MVKLKPTNLATTLPYDLKTVRFETDVKNDLQTDNHRYKLITDNLIVVLNLHVCLLQ